MTNGDKSAISLGKNSIHRYGGKNEIQKLFIKPVSRHDDEENR
jgi:hypothetical protein